MANPSELVDKGRRLRLAGKARFLVLPLLLTLITVLFQWMFPARLPASEPTFVSHTPDGLWFRVERGEVSIHSYSGTGGAVTIPNTINGFPVTAIAYDIHQEEGGAVTGITSVTIPGNVTSINGLPFFRYSKLTSITVSASNHKFSSVDGVLYDKKQTTLIECPQGLTSIQIPNSVKTIGGGAFSGCTGLAGITIPDSVTSIGGGAFDRCGLKSVAIPGSVTSIGEEAFSHSLASATVAASNPSYSCVNGVLFNKGMTTLIQNLAAKSGAYAIPKGVTSIRDNAFAECTGLTDVMIPDSVTGIGSTVFLDCTSLASVTIPNAVTVIGDSAFEGCKGLTGVTIPNGVASIGSDAFRGCTSLTSVTIPKSVTTMGESVFSGCSGLTSITIPDGVTTLGTGEFEDCSGLTSVTIPNSVTDIHDVFSGCSGLKSVTIPDGVTSIESDAFDGCTSLASVTIPKGVTTIGDNAFLGCKGLTSLTLPDGLASIGLTAFQGCEALTRLTIPKGVAAIGKDALSDCTGLTAITVTAPNPTYASADGVLFDSGITTLIRYPAAKSGPYTIPGGVTTIGENAFEGCTGLTRVTIPKGVTTIEKDAFSDCADLTTITVAEQNPSYTSVDGVLFDSGTTMLIQYPAGKSGSYTIPEGVTAIGQEIGKAGFSGCTRLTSVTIPKSVTSIGDNAFSGCSSLTAIHVTAPNSSFSSVDGVLFSHDATDLIRYPVAKSGAYKIPKNVTSVEIGAFSDCTGLTSITIPSGLTSLYDSDFGVFSGCTSLRAIHVTAPNSSFSSVDGVLFNSGATVLIRFPAGRAGSYVIPNGVTAFGQNAFEKCASLTSLTIPGSVKYIGSNSMFDEKDWFEDCSGLTSVIFTGSAPAMGTSPFHNAASGFKIYYPDGATGFTSPMWNGYPAVKGMPPKL